MNFRKTRNYLRNNLLVLIIKFIKFDVLYLTNSFITNIPAFYSNTQINIEKCLNIIQYNYSLLMIPDFVFKNIKTVKNDFYKVEVEEDMVLKISNKWKTITDYTDDLKKKYRNKIKKIINSTNNITIRSMNHDDLSLYADNIQDLFYQVTNKSRFNGPSFNTNSFLLLIKEDFFKIHGYFIKGELIAFSSEFHHEKILYSYYVGFSKTLNKTSPIYARILLTTINNAINLKMNKVVFGRTANEFKSNFGATPIKSYIYIKLKNKYLNIIFKPIFKRLRIRNWKQRNPFKK